MNKRNMAERRGSRPSLERLVESEDFPLQVLHPGGLQITAELARLCQVEGGNKVLDVASGTGESACYLAENFGAHVVGVDTSGHHVARAAKKAAERNLPVEFNKADAHNLPFDAGGFDVVISECTLCLLKKEMALREMVRVARSGGCVGMHDVCWKEDTPESLKRKLAEIENETPETLSGWKGLFEKAGLSDITAIDKSHLLPAWMEDIRKKLGLAGQWNIICTVLRTWGLNGLRTIWQSERIFRDPHTGYCLIVGRKP